MILFAITFKYFIWRLKWTVKDDYISVKCGPVFIAWMSNEKARRSLLLNVTNSDPIIQFDPDINISSAT